MYNANRISNLLEISSGNKEDLYFHYYSTIYSAITSRSKSFKIYRDSCKLLLHVHRNCFRNACPVKEEVVAPFWANNTRGEVLALLNLYPFEQYVHWEKCT